MHQLQPWAYRLLGDNLENDRMLTIYRREPPPRDHFGSALVKGRNLQKARAALTDSRWGH